MNDLARHTRQVVRMFQSAGIAKRPRKRLPRQVTPRMIEREYAKQMIELTQKVRMLLEPLYMELPGLLARANFERFDAGESKRLQQLIEQARARLADVIRPVDVENLAKKFAERTQTHQRIQLQNQTKAALGMDIFQTDRKLTTLMEHFVSENVALIKDLPGKLLTDVEKSVTRAVTSGTTHKELAADLEKQFGFTENRAKMIARDQIGKFYGQVNVARQKAIGVSRFIWRTMRDERVRDSHEEREGVIFSYDDPPDGELPGEPINCRCYPEPVFDDILADDTEE